jgi:hypothetical protein
MSKKPWDVTSTSSLEAFAEFVRRKSDASVVLIVRGADYAFAPASGVSPAAAKEAVEFVLPGAVEVAELRLKEEREAATRKRARQIVETGKGQ